MLIVKIGTTFPELRRERRDFEDWIIEGTGMERDRFHIVDVTRGEQLPPTGGLSGVIITGSHSMVTEHRQWSERTAEWLREVVAERIPLLGICYGHQLLAHAMGGRVGDNPYGREFGTVDVTFRGDDPLFRGLPKVIKAHVCHTQSVLSLPPEARPLASSKLEPTQAFVIGDCAWGVQFHPEFDEDITREYIRNCRQVLIEEGKDPDLLAESCESTPYAAGLLKRFAERCNNHNPA